MRRFRLTFTFLLMLLLLGLGTGQKFSPASPPQAEASSPQTGWIQATCAPAPADFTVNSTLDATDLTPGDNVCQAAGGVCTLRAAIQEANACPGDQIITLPAGTYTLSIAGADEDNAATGDLDITDSLTLQGSNAVIDADEIDRILDIHAGDITLTSDIASPSGLILQHGAVSADGGAIYARGTSLVIRNTSLIDNWALGHGGGMYSAITGSVSIDNALIYSNVAEESSGGLRLSGTDTITNSAIISNVSGGRRNLAPNMYTGGGGVGAIGHVTMTNVTVSGNFAWMAGGGLYSFADPLNPYNDNPERGFTLRHVTITNNTSSNSLGGGVNIVYNLYTSMVGVTMQSSILYGNIGNGGNLNRNCHPSVSSLGYNLVETGQTCAFTPLATDIVNQPPLLAPLALNNGHYVHLLQPNSPALNGAGAIECVATDQRGILRPAGVTCDIGAVEMFDTNTPAPELVSPANNASVTQVLLTWTPVPGAEGYEVQLSTNTPPTTVTTLPGNTTTYSPDFPLTGIVYYWRVRAFSGSDYGAWSETRSFTLGSLSANTPLLWRYTTETAALAWGRISWATAYEIQVSDTDTFSALAFSEALPAATSQTSTTPLANGRYYWRVRAQRADGTWGAWSPASSFVIDMP